MKFYIAGDIMAKPDYNLALLFLTNFRLFPLYAQEIRAKLLTPEGRQDLHDLTLGRCDGWVYMGGKEAQDKYAETWEWQCPQCGLVSGQWCDKNDPLDNAPHCCAGVKMIKTTVWVRAKKGESCP